MAYKIRRSINIYGQQRWITADSEQEYAEKLSKLFCPERDTINMVQHNFKDYANTWYELYCKPNIATVTQKTYERQLRLHLIPAFGEKAIEEITPDDIQCFLNEMTGAKATKDKARMVLSMILNAAIDDGFISRNPVHSKRVKVNGKPTEYTKCYTVEQMLYLIDNLPNIHNPLDRMYLAIQALHPFRLEEVLGLQWQDIDLENRTITVRRAVTHPTRNQPEVKEPKTEASKRTIELSSIAANYLTTPGEPKDYIFGGKCPLSYSRIRRMCDRIQKDTNFEESITPIRFRTTVLTDIYEQTKDVKLAQAAAGHATAAMTLKHYIKARAEIIKSAGVLDRAYTLRQ